MIAGQGWRHRLHFPGGLYRAEQVIAERLIRIVNGRLPWPWIDEEKAVALIEKRLQLADSQRAAIRLAPTAKALVITGGPGVGKTTIVNSILKILVATRGPWGAKAIIACRSAGPTRRASRRNRSTDSWRSIPRAAVSNATPTIRSSAICSLS